jgi:hypothetical protein
MLRAERAWRIDMGDQNERKTIMNATSSANSHILEGYAQFGGQQAEAAALRNVLTHTGFVSSQTGEPLSEAMIFGIGGGIGAAYFTFEYASESVKTIFLGTRINTQESKAPVFHQAICERLGIEVEVLNSGSASAAEKKLIKSLEGCDPLVLWIDPGRRAYFPLTERPSHYHTIVAFGLDEQQDQVHIADLSDKAIKLRRSDLAAAREIEGAGRISFRALKIKPPGRPLDLRSSILAGLRAGAEQMLHGWDIGGAKGNFGVQGLRKWAALLTDPKDKKGWPQFFSSDVDLLAALMSIYDQIENRGNGVGAFRPLYADFLDQAGKILEIGELKNAADEMRSAGRMWSELAAALLPEDVDDFAEMRALSSERRRLFAEQGGQALDEIRSINTRMENLRSELKRDFPLEPGDVVELLSCAQEKVLAIAQVEEEVMTGILANLD